MIKKVEIKLLSLKERMKKKVADNSGQGALDTAIICEPFLD